MKSYQIILQFVRCKLKGMLETPRIKGPPMKTFHSGCYASDQVLSMIKILNPINDCMVVICWICVWQSLVMSNYDILFVGVTSIRAREEQATVVQHVPTPYVIPANLALVLGKTWLYYVGYFTFSRPFPNFFF